MVENINFQMFDFGAEENMKKYNQVSGLCILHNFKTMLSRL